MAIKDSLFETGSRSESGGIKDSLFETGSRSESGGIKDSLFETGSRSESGGIKDKKDSLFQMSRTERRATSFKDPLF